MSLTITEAMERINQLTDELAHTNADRDKQILQIALANDHAFGADRVIETQAHSVLLWRDTARRNKEGALAWERRALELRDERDVVAGQRNALASENDRLRAALADAEQRADVYGDYAAYGLNGSGGSR